jgi:hypothetical protein
VRFVQGRLPCRRPDGLVISCHLSYRFDDQVHSFLPFYVLLSLLQTQQLGMQMGIYWVFMGQAPSLFALL